MKELTIHLRLAKLRKAKKITQQELADAIGTSYQNISKWENGITLPDITMLPVLASFFDTSVDELLGLVPLKGEVYQESGASTEDYWNRKLQYLERTRKDNWNEDYLQFLIQSVWKIDRSIHILDLGCGYGYMGLLLMPFFPKGSQYTGIDFAKHLIRHGRTLFQEKNIAGNLICGDIFEMPETARYDIVLCQSVLRHMGNSEPLIRKMMRLAKKDGLIVCIDTNREFECAGLYIDGMDYGELCDHAGMEKYWKCEYENGDRDYAAAMRNAHMMRKLGILNVQIRMSDAVSFICPEQAYYAQKKEDFISAENAWSEKEKTDRAGAVSHMVSKGMTRIEAENYLNREQKIETYLLEHEDASYTRFRGKMISFGYNP